MTGEALQEVTKGPYMGGRTGVCVEGRDQDGRVEPGRVDGRSVRKETGETEVHGRS